MSQTQSFVVLGATGGVGSALVELLHAQGHNIMLGARNETALAALSAKHGNAPYQVVDVTRSEQVDACVQQAKTTFGRIDGLVNCAGTLTLKPVHLLSDAAFEHDLAVNLKSSFYALRAAVKAMGNKQGGSIVLMSSAAARLGLASHESIAAAKAGVLGLMLSAAASYASDNIRVNAVAPGLIDTELTKSITGNKLMAEASANMHPLHKFGDPAQVARCIAFLLDGRNDFITGQTLGVDGGLATLRSKR